MANAESMTLEKPEAMRERTTLVPLVDVVETDEGLELLVELPGVPIEGLEVKVEEDVLAIDGRVSSPMPVGARRLYEEFPTADFHRAFALRGDFDRERIEATLRNGLLRLVLPKSERSRTRQVEIQSA